MSALINSLSGSVGAEFGGEVRQRLTDLPTWQERSIRIKRGSVEEKGGKIEYKTEDGTPWRFDYSKRADHTCQYGMSEEVK